MKERSIRRKLSKVSALIESAGRLKDYKDLFKFFGEYFLISEIILNVDPKITVSELVDLELRIFDNPSEDLFRNTLTKISWNITIFFKVDWRSLELFLGYVYEQKKFKKGQQTTLFTEKTVIAACSLKRTFFNKWLISFSEKTNNFNQLVLFILKKTET